MNREVHYVLTKEWARSEGFSPEDAERIAAADWACDKLYIHTLADKRYHWPALGSVIVWRRRLSQALRDDDLVALGESLHALQDTIGHGFLGHFWHWPGIDRLEHRSARVRRRLETRSRKVLARYALHHTNG